LKIAGKVYKGNAEELKQDIFDISLTLVFQHCFCKLFLAIFRSEDAYSLTNSILKCFPDYCNSTKSQSPLSRLSWWNINMMQVWIITKLLKQRTVSWFL